MNQKPTCDGLESKNCPLKDNKKVTVRGRRQRAPPPAPSRPAACSAFHDESDPPEADDDIHPEHIASLERVRLAVWLAKLSALLLAFIVVASVGIFVFLALSGDGPVDTSFLSELFLHLHAIVMAVLTAGS